MHSFPKLTILWLGAIWLGGCSSLPSMGGFSSGGGENYAAHSTLGRQLTRGDAQILASTFLAAMDAPAGAPQGWAGKRARGAVIPGAYALANLLADPARRVSAARADLDLVHVMETDLGLYVLTRNSNVRTGPGTENKITEILPSGAGVEVVGRVADKSWMLVAANDVVRGYVFQDLLIKAPGTELELAGGPQRRPLLCRAFTQRLQAYGQRDRWAGAACNDGSGWRLAPPEPEAVQGDDELLGL